MGFLPISIDAYVARQIKGNPEINEIAFRAQLTKALDHYFAGNRCACGTDIWVIGSIYSGNKCFSCITGEEFPNNAYEIESAIKKEDFSFPDYFKGGHYFDDEGNVLDPTSIITPALCLACRHYNDPYELILCNLNRLDQRNDREFICHSYRPK